MPAGVRLGRACPLARRRRWPQIRPHTAGWLAAGALAAGLVSGCSGSTPPGNLISVSTGTCGTGWQQVTTGMQTFQVRNSSTGGAEVDLIDPADGAVYAEVEALGPGTTRPMRVDVGSGRYAFRCLIEDTDAITGPTVRVPGHVKGAPAILPVTTDDLLAPASEYHAYVTAGLSTLAGQTDALAAAASAATIPRPAPTTFPALVATA